MPSGARSASLTTMPRSVWAVAAHDHVLGHVHQTSGQAMVRNAVSAAFERRGVLMKCQHGQALTEGVT